MLENDAGPINHGLCDLDVFLPRKNLALGFIVLILDLMNDAVEVVFVDDPPFMVVHQLQHKLVKEDPFVFEEFVEEDIHVVDRDD